MPYMCKVENVAGLQDSLNQAINNAQAVKSMFKYKIVKAEIQADAGSGSGARNNWVNLGLSGTRYHVVDVIAIESPDQNSFLFIPYYSYNGRWRARVFNSNGFIPITSGILDLIVYYIDNGSAITVPSDYTLG